MKRKIFLSLGIPDKSRNRLVETTKKWQDLPIKWIRAQNLHLTLIFLGFVETEDLPEICQKISFATDNVPIFDIELDEIRLFPDESGAKMICLTGKTSEELKKLVSDIEIALDISKGPKKIFQPKITLGRIRKHKWDTLENRPEISEKFPLTMTAEAIDIMASDFDTKGNAYSVIESCPLT